MRAAVRRLSRICGLSGIAISGQPVRDLHRAGGLRFDTSPRGVTLGTTQRMIAHYESRAEKAPAALWPQMVPALKASADQLLGIKPLKKGKSPVLNSIDACNESRRWTQRPNARSHSYSIPPSSARN